MEKTLRFLALAFACAAGTVLLIRCGDETPGSDGPPNDDNDGGWDPAHDASHSGDPDAGAEDVLGVGDDVPHVGDGAADEDSGASALDGGGGDSGPSDGGDPLEQPLSEFCRGEGTVVTVGGSGQCAGDLAEETFQFGLCACETISVQSTLTIDAFNSSLGLYGAPTVDGGINVLQDGHLGINGALSTSAKLTVQGSAYVGGGGIAVGASSLIAGNLYAAGTSTQANSSTEVGRNAFIDGDVVGRFVIAGDLHVPATASVSAQTSYRQLVREPIRPLRPCPCSDAEILDIPALTAWGATHNDNSALQVVTSTTWASGTGPDTIELPCGRYYLTQIQHPRTLTIRATGRTVLFVDGDLAISGGLNLAVEPEAEIDLFVAGNLSVTAASRIGSSDRPAAVRSYIGGTGAINLRASSEFGGNVYAPRAHVDFGASAELFGAVFVRQASFSGSASVHFDQAVRSAGDECRPPPPPTDGGVIDGSVDTDASSSGDASSPADAGSSADAGSPTDGGTATDASSGSDASSGNDAGPTPVSCTACNQCAMPLGCVIESGETSGVCGECQSDFDCCAPASCRAGRCEYQL